MASTANINSVHRSHPISISSSKETTFLSLQRTSMPILDTVFRILVAPNRLLNTPSSRISPSTPLSIPLRSKSSQILSLPLPMRSLFAHLETSLPLDGWISQEMLALWMQLSPLSFKPMIATPWLSKQPRLASHSVRTKRAFLLRSPATPLFTKINPLVILLSVLLDQTSIFAVLKLSLPLLRFALALPSPIGLKTSSSKNSTEIQTLFWLLPSMTSSLRLAALPLYPFTIKHGPHTARITMETVLNSLLLFLFMILDLKWRLLCSIQAILCKYLVEKDSQQLLFTMQMLSPIVLSSWKHKVLVLTRILCISLLVRTLLLLLFLFTLVLISAIMLILIFTWILWIKLLLRFVIIFVLRLKVI